MEFLTKNKTLVALALAVILTVLGAVFKIDVGAMLGNVGTINKEVTNLVDPVVPAKPVE